MKTNLLFVIYPLYRKSPTTVGIIKNIDIAIMPMPRKQHFAKYPELVTVYSWVPPKRLLSFWRKLGWLDLQPPKATLWWIDLESICGKRSSLPEKWVRGARYFSEFVNNGFSCERKNDDNYWGNNFIFTEWFLYHGTCYY